MPGQARILGVAEKDSCVLVLARTCLDLFDVLACCA